jgi:hypothetical protein
MKSSFLLRNAVAALTIILVAAVVPGLGEDYLVIKKKGGPTQKVPLQFSPEQIESFQVESAPSPAAPTGSQEQQAEPEEPSPTTKQRGPFGPAQPEPKPLQIRPGGPSPGPSILREPAEMAPPRDTGASRAVEREERRETVPAPVKRPLSGPVAADTPRAVGSFFVNIYKLPEQIKALPDYSAFKPRKTVPADKVDIDPAKGEREPVGLPDDSDGLGMRFVGMFMVSGEGIFEWRILSKDGARLNIDDKTLIENDGIHGPSAKNGFVHLSEGVHTIVLDSFNSSGPPILKLFVTPPMGKEQLFSMRTGLAGWREPEKPYDVLWGQVYFVPKGNYPAMPDLSRLSPIGRLISSELNITGGEGFPGLPGRKDMIGIRYEGFFNVEGAGIFAFKLLADHYARLTVGDKTIAEIAGGAKSNPDGKLGWAFLQKGSYPIAVDYFHPQGPPLLQLYVTQPVKPEELFAPAQTLQGFSSEEGKINQIPAFVYFLKPNTTKMPNFNKITPAGMFFTSSVDYPVDRGSREFPGVPKRDEWLGLRFYVKFALTDKESGDYKFRVVCRDAARLIVGKKLIINAEGLGRVQEKLGEANLGPGSHEMFLDYMHTTGPNGIQLFITPPGGEEKVFAFQ